MRGEEGCERAVGRASRSEPPCRPKQRCMRPLIPLCPMTHSCAVISPTCVALGGGREGLTGCAFPLQQRSGRRAARRGVARRERAPSAA